MVARILVADDDPGNREIVASLLRAEGYEVDCAADGEAALDLIESHGIEYYDVLLTDVLMPKMNGLELARAVCARPHHPWTVVMSGTARPEEAEAAGAEGFLRKPFGLGELLAAV